MPTDARPFSVLEDWEPNDGLLTNPTARFSIKYVAAVALVDGYEVRVYTRDHPPAHVHVHNGSARIKISLEPDVAYMSHKGLATARELRRAIEIVAEHAHACLALWRRYHS